MMLRGLLFLLFLPAAALADAYPRVVEHALGRTTIPDEPRRIVSAGYHEQDFLYALGLAPVGVHEWFGNRPHATWPWAEDARKAVGATPAVQYGFEIDAEWAYAQKPDLIVVSFFNLDRATYDLLSRIAPVVAAPKGYPVWGAPWQEELRLIARATGRESKVEAIISGIDRRIDDIAQANPGFAGKTATIGYFVWDHFAGYRSTGGGNARTRLSLRCTNAALRRWRAAQRHGWFRASARRRDTDEDRPAVYLLSRA